MKFFSFASVFALALITSNAGAAPIQIDIPTHIEPIEKGLTRAEVVADFHLWRLSGLQNLTRGERSADTSSLEYRRAFATYVHLKASPQFATLVNQLQQGTNQSVVARRQTDRVAQTTN